MLTAFWPSQSVEPTPFLLLWVRTATGLEPVVPVNNAELQMQALFDHAQANV